MGVHGVYINNQHGTLIYHRDRAGPNKKALSANETIIVASTLHGMSGIASQLAPTPKKARHTSGRSDLIGAMLSPKGISSIEGDQIKVVCYESLTGLRIFMVCDQATPPNNKECQALLRTIYEAFANHVLKNPFADTDMPVRLQTFDAEIDKALAPFSP